MTDSTRTTRVATWNVEWATPRSARAQPVADHLVGRGADILVITEGVAEVLPPDGFIVDSDPDYGYSMHAGRRKVLLWSRKPWEGVDRLGTADLPPGRFVSAITQTPIGPIRVIGVCIPWAAAHVSSGRRDRQRWEDHLIYLCELGRLLGALPALPPVVVAGDFNQQVPPSPRNRPHRVSEELSATFSDLQIVTAGEVPGPDRTVIDHIALGGGLRATNVAGWPRTLDEIRLSDHAGVQADIALD